MDFIGDIVERNTSKKGASAPQPPAPPDPSATSTGFPAPRKRVSAFKQRRNNEADPDAVPIPRPAAAAKKVSISTPLPPTTTQTLPTPLAKYAPSQTNASDEKHQTEPGSKKTENKKWTSSDSIDANERKQISEENDRRLAAMSAEEIEEARAELFSLLDPSVIQKLMARANLDERGSSELPKPIKTGNEAKTAKSSSEIEIDDANPAKPTAVPPKIVVDEVKEEKIIKPEKKVQFEEAEKDVTTKNTMEPKTNPSGNSTATPVPRPKAPQTVTLEEIEEIVDKGGPGAGEPSGHDHDHRGGGNDEVGPHIHFPKQQLPDLDPNDPNFLETLHEKYFPDTPMDPSKLAWMAPVPSEDSPADRESPYYPGQESLPVSSLRFDFRGRLVPPRVSRKIPVSKGLHHHGMAPEAAGYTIGELALYSRSAVPAQRCIAYQTAGRVLYRLGLGEWGKSIDDVLAMGIWAALQEGRILQSLTDEATKEQGHRGSIAYATEALWLFERGGWKNQLRGI